MVLFTDINPYYIALAMAPVTLFPLAIPLIGLGGQLLSGLFNRKSQSEKDAEKAQTRLANAQAKLARGRGQRETQFFNQANPIIGTLIPQLQALLSGDREKLTQRFAPSLNALTAQREAAQRRIETSGVQGGASVQAGLELEKSSFAERSRLLSSAPAEAQAGLTQLLELLIGAGNQAGAGATQAAGISGAANESIIQGGIASRAGNQGFFDSLVKGAGTFGRAIFNPGGVPSAPGGSIASLTGNASGAVFENPTPVTSFTSQPRNLPRRATL